MDTKLKAILLAAGLGTRLKPLTDFLPKCMMPVNGRPLLEYWLESLSEAGVKPLLINLHYFPDIVEESLQYSEYRDNITTVFEPELLGTGGTLLKNRDFVNNEAVMLIHADNLCLVNLKEFISAHITRPSGTVITMMTFATPTPETCGIVELDKRGVVTAFHEKVPNPPGNLANAAVYIIEPCVFDFLSKLNKPVIDFSTEVLPYYQGHIYTYHNTCYHRDIGTLDSLISAQTEYPGVSWVPRKDDFWKIYCEKDKAFVMKQILASLANTLNAHVINVQDADSLIDTAISKKIKNIILNVQTPLKNSDKDVIHVVKSCPPGAEWVLFFSRVGSGFSSKQIFDQYGLKSLAVCASN
ncbi:MAG: nucleotidyltransferase family protein [bacterium]|nr:nucleotidyltransferase family protein [bacterium]